MEYLSDNEIEAFSNEEKLNALKIINFQNISDCICNECSKYDDCDGYFSSSCVCRDEWDDILSYLVRAEQSLRIAAKETQRYSEKHPAPSEPLYYYSSYGKPVINYG